MHAISLGLGAEAEVEIACDSEAVALPETHAPIPARCRIEWTGGKHPSHRRSATAGLAAPANEHRERTAARATEQTDQHADARDRQPRRADPRPPSAASRGPVPSTALSKHRSTIQRALQKPTFEFGAGGSQPVSPSPSPGHGGRAWHRRLIGDWRYTNPPIFLSFWPERPTASHTALRFSILGTHVAGTTQPWRHGSTVQRQREK